MLRPIELTISDITHLLKPDEDKKKEMKAKRQKTKPETTESGMSVKTGKVFKENLQKKLNQVVSLKFSTTLKKI
jgi:hypothetical protein